MNRGFFFTSLGSCLFLFCSSSMLSRLLHVNNHKILEDDNVFLHHQERALYRPLNLLGDGTTATTTQWRKRYFLPTPANAAVAALRTWLERYGSFEGVLWSPNARLSEPPAGVAEVAEATGGIKVYDAMELGSRTSALRMAPLQPLPLEALIERRRSHTAHCASCSAVLAKAERIAKMSSTATGLLLALAVITQSINSSFSAVVPPAFLAAAAIVSAAVRVAAVQITQKLTEGEYPPPRNRQD
jgi:hypothetical protein